MGSGKTLLGVAAAAAAVAAGMTAARRIAERRPAVQRVAPELRSPILYVLPSLFGDEPPHERPWLTNVMNGAVVRAGATAQVFPGQAGDPAVAGFLYDPPARRRPSGAVLWIHGGGMVMGTAAQSHAAASRMAGELGVVVATVDYRLAP